MMRSLLRRVLTGPVRRPVTRPIRNAPARARLGLEGLEAREVPATFLVTNLLDDGSDGSLRWAVAQANSTAGSDDIVFDGATFATPQTITLGGTQLTLTDSAQTTITGPTVGITVSGGGLSRVFEIDGAAALTGLTVSGGRTAASSTANTGGAGLLVTGTAVLAGCTITDNSATGNGGGVFLVWNSGSNPRPPVATLTMTDCTVSNN